MKACHAVIVFLFLAMPALFIGFDSYNNTKDIIVDDMSRALAQTLQEQKLCVINPDTIANYKKHLSIAELRENSFVSFASGDNHRQFLASRKIRWKGRNNTAFQAYANIGTAAILGLSDQRLSATLTFLSFAWLLFALRIIKKNRTKTLFGEIAYDENNKEFYDFKQKRIDFTPMQKDVMIMLWQANNHIVHKNLICEKLWPKKPDASETLYTLVKRLRKKLESTTKLIISSDNNGHYRLKENKG
jgi:hypothetical protein